LVYLPETFLAKLENLHSDFQFDPAIPLPVDLDEAAAESAFKNDKLTIEMIIAGMIRVLVEGSPVEYLAYYRNFILAVKPNILKEFSGAAILKSKNKDFVIAREILNALKALFPVKPEVLLLDAVVLEDQFDYLRRNGKDSAAETVLKEAEEAYKKALSVEEILPNTLFNAGFFYKKLGDYPAAHEYFSEYVNIADDEMKKAKALANIRGIEKRNLDDERFYHAYTLIRKGQEDEGMNILRPFLEQHPDMWRAWFLLGWALRRRERWEDGAAALRKALELDGSKADTRNELALCLMEIGDLQSAKKELEIALTLENENIKIISNLAILCLKTGDKKSAEGFFRTVLELDPEDLPAKSYLANLGLDNV
jgi:tetratricopeptide (TPR) repeat protein